MVAAPAKTCPMDGSKKAACNMKAKTVAAPQQSCSGQDAAACAAKKAAKAAAPAADFAVKGTNVASAKVVSLQPVNHCAGEQLSEGCEYTKQLGIKCPKAIAKLKTLRMATVKVQGAIAKAKIELGNLKAELASLLGDTVAAR